MAKTPKKYIQLGTGTDELNSRDIPANFTPSTYTPTQISSEGTDKISAHLKGIDLALASGGLSVGSEGTNDQVLNIVTDNSTTTIVDFTSATRSFKSSVTVVIDATTDTFEVFDVNGFWDNSDWYISAEKIGTPGTGVNLAISSGGLLSIFIPTTTGFSSAKVTYNVISRDV